MRGCRCSLVRPRRAPDPPAKERERLRELRELRELCDLRVKRVHAGHYYYMPGTTTKLLTELCQCVGHLAQLSRPQTVSDSAI